jgi:hypothetical protein
MTEIFGDFSHGYDSPQEMIATVKGIGAQIYVAPSGRDAFKRRLAEQGEVKNWEYQVYRKDGTILWVEEDTRAVRDASGKLLYYEGIIQDISERKQQEEALKRQLQELQIEIYQKKREHEVALITESGYFQELQEQMSSLNLDEFWI